MGGDGQRAGRIALPHRLLPGQYGCTGRGDGEQFAAVDDVAGDLAHRQDGSFGDREMAGVPAAVIEAVGGPDGELVQVGEVGRFGAQR